MVALGSDDTIWRNTTQCAAWSGFTFGTMATGVPLSPSSLLLLVPPLIFPSLFFGLVAAQKGRR
jgi:hypothetical protein